MIGKIKNITENFKKKTEDNKDKLTKQQPKYYDKQIYLIYYFPPNIYIKPISNKTLLTMLTPYISIYNVDGKEIKGILVFYGIPFQKRDLEELEKAKDKEKYYMYKALDFWTSLESLASYKGKMLYNTLANPSGTQVSEVKASNSLPKIEINYYPFLTKAYEMYLMLQEKNAVLLKPVQQVKSWKDVITNVFNHMIDSIVKLSYTNPRGFLMLIVTFIIFAILIYIMIVLKASMSTISTLTVNVVNATTVTP